MGIKVDENISRNGEILGSNTAEHVAEHMVMIFFHKNWNSLLRPEIWRPRRWHDPSRLNFKWFCLIVLFRIFHPLASTINFSRPAYYSVGVDGSNSRGEWYFSKQRKSNFSRKFLVGWKRWNLFQPRKTSFWRKFDLQSSQFLQCQKCQPFRSITEIVRSRKYAKIKIGYY